MGKYAGTDQKDDLDLGRRPHHRLHYDLSVRQKTVGALRWLPWMVVGESNLPRISLVSHLVIYWVMEEEDVFIFHIVEGPPFGGI